MKGIELAENQFHTLVALEPDSVIFELKQGPYQPSHDKDFIASFPPEGTLEARQQELHWRARQLTFRLTSPSVPAATAVPEESPVPPTAIPMDPTA